MRDGDSVEEPSSEQQRMEQDAVRLYGQGWSIRRVAAEFGCGYGTMRRILAKQGVVRDRGGRTAGTFGP